MANRFSDSHSPAMGIMALLCVVVSFLAVSMALGGLMILSRKDTGNESQIQELSKTSIIRERQLADTGPNQRREILHTESRGQSPGTISEGSSVE